MKKIMKVQISEWFVVLMIFALSGCSTSLPSIIKEPSVEPPPEAQKIETISQLANGKRGFVITEVNTLSPEQQVNYQEALFQLEHNDAELAIALLEEIVMTEPGMTAPYISLARAYEQVEETGQAEVNLQMALELIPGHPLASHEYGLLLRHSGRFVESRQIYENSLDIFPDYLPIRKNLGILCDLYLNDPECALAQFQYYSDAVPDDEQVALWVSEIQMR